VADHLSDPDWGSPSALRSRSARNSSQDLVAGGAIGVGRCPHGQVAIDAAGKPQPALGMTVHARLKIFNVGGTGLMRRIVRCTATCPAGP
jgi:hypothetical protein